MEWIRYGNKFSTTKSETMNFVIVFDGFSVSKIPFDYLYTDKKLANLCAYVFLMFFINFRFVRF